MKGLLVSLVMVILTGCAATNQRADYINRPDMVTIQVRNYNWQDVTVYILDGSLKKRLGFVTTTTTKTFNINENTLPPSGNIRLYADPIGANDTFASESINIGSGGTIIWEVRQPLNMSNLYIY
jgi:outer membrane biogenesis lipoprotein LolB